MKKEPKVVMLKIYPEPLLEGEEWAKYPDGRLMRHGDIDCSADVPLVKQEFKDDCDVNKIIERCLRTGSPLPVQAGVEPAFADVTQIGDFRDVVHRVEAAEAAFMSLDARVRGRFNNDPGELIRFLSDESNREEAQKLGFLKAQQPQADEPTPAKPASSVSKESLNDDVPDKQEPKAIPKPKK